MEQQDHQLTAIECPNCGFDIDAEITTVLRVNDQALESYFEGELNRVICHQCSQEFLYETPLVFKSDDQSYIVYYNPDIAPLGWEEATKQMSQVLGASLEDLPLEERPECRLTLTRNEFLEKIALHMSELDDRLIEYMKFHIFSQEADLNGDTHELLYDFSRSNHDMIEFTVINKLEGKVLQNTQTPIEMLQQLDALLESDECPIDIDELLSGLYVQVERLLQN
ncbi:MAG: hypothetical protein HRT88_07115 [Lentisphaeraceae bacterium]|nr:hypothetical protein [Lentisphaeraceae bacterium]